MAVTTTFAFPNERDVSINKVFYDQFVMYEPEYPKIAKISMKAPPGSSITESELSGLGNMEVLPEGAGVTFDKGEEGNKVTRYYVKYGLGWQYTLEAAQDDVAGHWKKYPKELAKSASHNVDLKYWDLFNSGFATHTAMDGQYIFDASGRTLLKDGSAQNNRPSTDAALSLTSLAAALEYFYGLKDHSGRPMIMVPNTLVIPKELIQTAEILLGTEKKVGGMDNDINYVYDKNIKIFVSRYLTSSTAWFLLSDDHDFRIVWKQKTKLSSDNDFGTQSKLYMTSQRFAHFCNQYWGGYGTTGA